MCGGRKIAISGLEGLIIIVGLEVLIKSRGQYTFKVLEGEGVTGFSNY